MVKNFLSRNNTVHTRIISGFIAVLLVVCVSYVFSAKEETKEEKDIQEYVGLILETCGEEQYTRACFDKEIPKLMDHISMEDAFEVAKVIQNNHPEYGFCHVLGHNLSERETRKDPNKWKDVIIRCPSGTCVNGCIHGAFQERFSTESMTGAELDSIIPELKTICDSRDAWTPTGRKKVACYHALGHLLMYITNADVNKSLELCEWVGVKDDGSNYLESCSFGVFMQVFKADGPEDAALVKDIAPQTQEEAEIFCANFPDAMHFSCHRESWYLYQDELRVPSGVEEFCAYTDNEIFKTRCYNDIFYIIAASFKHDISNIKEYCATFPDSVENLCLVNVAVAQLQNDVSKITAYCSTLKDSQKGICVTNAATRMIATDHNFGEKAVSLCEVAGTYEMGTECYNRLIFQSTFNYLPGSNEAQSICDAMPTSWKVQCEKDNNSATLE